MQIIKKKVDIISHSAIISLIFCLFINYKTLWSIISHVILNESVKQFEIVRMKFSLFTLGDSIRWVQFITLCFNPLNTWFLTCLINFAHTSHHFIQSYFHSSSIIHFHVIPIKQRLTINEVKFKVVKLLYRLSLNLPEIYSLFLLELMIVHIVV